MVIDKIRFGSCVNVHSITSTGNNNISCSDSSLHWSVDLSFYLDIHLNVNETRTGIGVEGTDVNENRT